jgi:hypothetical protein
MNQLTPTDIVTLMNKTAQSCRENGESDMRTILNVGWYLQKCINEEKDRDVIIAEFEEENEDD